MRPSYDKGPLFLVLIHAGIVVLVVVATTLLALNHTVPGEAAVGVFGTALGFAGVGATQHSARRRDDRSNGGG